MTTAPKLTDRIALTLHRARTQQDALFLHELAADQLQDRLGMVKKRFTDVAIVTGHPQTWADRFPNAKIVPDTPTLTLEVGAHDLLIHAMALHWADDPVGQVIQCRRALRPDGLFLSVSPGGQTLAELRAVLAQAEANVAGGLSPRVAPMMDLRDAGALLQRAGLALPVADAERFTVTYADSPSLMRELRAMGEGNALHARDRRIPPRALFAEAARLYAQHHPAADDPARIQATVELIHLSGWAPDDSQPKPLRPGSASARLADALGTTELRPSDNSSGPED
ncbi:hypothetical protein PARPLA_00195 [Rhodobacteraceae bacterium THAF1]|uniref:SAM-dependent methyltransferase n=1 Tax=Palleronia sp. THAF1 TaxID=2587842 RepID=UPI000F3DBB8E|nr:SAM-dependent methyltransferase [Palleronia sp. THAF1]QFU10240.1 hypothetical protein FIU81_16285 [Palleronia sp. THAF1]VDC16855.1 hypothetical protein PARPLA_00195 [Rhodobacteraceae bacterium THAF1]